MFKVITGTLQANHNTMQLTDETITNDSIFEVYTDTENVIPSSVSVGGHTVTITFDSKPSNNIGIKVLINNIVGEFAPDTIDAENVNYTTERLPSVENVKNGLDEIINSFDFLSGWVTDGFVDIYEKLADDDTVLGGVLYHATTGNMWKKLDASNINYDDSSTIYSAMGDIDELETENKNLVDAINELNARPSGGVDYSLTEQNTGKKWIDGRTIYQRTYNIYSGVKTNNVTLTSSDIPNIAEIDYPIHCLFVCPSEFGCDTPPIYKSGNTLIVKGVVNFQNDNSNTYTIQYVKVV